MTRQVTDAEAARVEVLRSADRENAAQKREGAVHFRPYPRQGKQAMTACRGYVLSWDGGDGTITVARTDKPELVSCLACLRKMDQDDYAVWLAGREEKK